MVSLVLEPTKFIMIQRINPGFTLNHLLVLLMSIHTGTHYQSDEPDEYDELSDALTMCAKEYDLVKDYYDEISYLLEPHGEYTIEWLPCESGILIDEEWIC